jgi:spermidine synthase
MSIRFTEEYPEVDAAFSIQVDKILFKGKSKYQKIEILETRHFGRILIIDGFIMLTELDEFVYHEMIAHVPLYVHPNPENVLVIGGGDGGTVREVVKHSVVKQVDLVDIDRLVSEVSLKFLPTLSNKLLSERVNCVYQDASSYVKNIEKKYDVIIVDSTDPINIGEGLFTREFYQNCFNVLQPTGILVNQAESPIFSAELVGFIAKKMKVIFDNLDFYQANIPTYPSGYWLFGFASKKYHPLKDFQEDRYHKNKLKLKYYNSDLHFASFALPNFVRDIVD